MMKRLLTGLKYLLYACTAGLTAYILYYVFILTYYMNFIDKQDDQIRAQIRKENNEYRSLSYVERYIPPINKHKNIPESAFWIPHTKSTGLFIYVTVSEENKDRIHVKLYPDVVLDGSWYKSEGAVLILKKAFQGDNVSFSRFTHPNLPTDKVTYKLKSGSSVPNEIQQAFPDDKKHWYLEYPQGYLVMETDQD